MRDEDKHDVSALNWMALIFAALIAITATYQLHKDRNSKVELIETNKSK